MNFRKLFSSRQNRYSRKSHSRRKYVVELLETRRLMATDLGASPCEPIPDGPPAFIAEATASAEGEAANDLVAFAFALTNAGHKLYGADWSADTSAQRRLFKDGVDFLDFTELTNPDQTSNGVGEPLGISVYPTWILQNGTLLPGVQSLSQLSAATGIAIPQSSTPYIRELSNETVFSGSPLHIPIDAYDPNGNPLTITVLSSNPSAVNAVVLSGNQSARFTTEYGDMVFELFNAEASRPVTRFTTLAQSGFYNTTATQTMTFHRIIENFVLQGGDPLGTGLGGSSLGNFDDQYDVDLQHNRKGILSFAKSTDDTNNSQFFITNDATRFLDFQHSIFGQQIEGDLVRTGIARTQVGGTNNDSPVRPPKILNIQIFDDNENGLVRLIPVGAPGSQSDITVTVTDTEGNQTSRTFTVSVAADAFNSQPFLNDIPTIVGTINQQDIAYQLTSQDVEGDTVRYLAEYPAGETVPYNGNINPGNGTLLITPPTGFIGSFSVRVKVVQTGTLPDANPDPGENAPTDIQLVRFQINAPMTLSVTRSVLLEGGDGATATVTRAVASMTDPLSVIITTSVAGQLTTSQTVTIPANQSSITFPVSALDDSVADGSQKVTLTVQAQNYFTASQTIDVIDNDSANPWHNSLRPGDTDNNGVVAPLDVLLVINRLARIGTGVLPIPGGSVSGFFDVSNDFILAPLDILQVINILRRQTDGGEGEAASTLNSASIIKDATLADTDSQLDTSSQLTDAALALWSLEDLYPSKTRKSR
jgi:cyclophilin family peptidyl-prolyl cis-trans isomerase